MKNNNAHQRILAKCTCAHDGRSLNTYSQQVTWSSYGLFPYIPSPTLTHTRTTRTHVYEKAALVLLKSFSSQHISVGLQVKKFRVQCECVCRCACV